MFELQNNRGKDLTDMEKLKSYLAYQIYTYCGDDAETKLGEMTKNFEEVYRLLNDINAREDDILNYFNISKSKFGFGYREDNNESNYKKELKAIEIKEAKIAWIDEYVKELKNAFVDFKEFEKSQSIYKEYLQILSVKPIYPFIIKAYRLFRGNNDILEQIFKALEIIAFRHRLTKRGASLASRLNSVIKDFDSIDSLSRELKKVCSEKEWYWSDSEIIKNSLIFAYRNYSNEKDKEKSALPYLLMRYENYLRSKNSKTKGYSFKLEDIEQRQIEHIAPQTETIEESGKEKASGYCEYDDEFLEYYLNCIGNLVLISKSHNCSIGNEPFHKKLEDYQLIEQQKEIKNFASGDKWDKEAINKRHEELEKFVLETWSFK